MAKDIVSHKKPTGQDFLRVPWPKNTQKKFTVIFMAVPYGPATAARQDIEVKTNWFAYDAAASAVRFVYREKPVEIIGSLRDEHPSRNGGHVWSGTLSTGRKFWVYED